jgi:UPF0755 protein
MMNIYKKIIIFNLIALIFSLSVGGWIVFKFYQFVNSPASNQSDGVYIEIDKGENLYSIIKKLKRAHIIGRSDWFYYYVKLKGSAKKIKAGTHFFKQNYSPKEVLKELVNISIYTVRVRIPEGSSLKQIAKVLTKTNYNGDKFLNLVYDSSFCSSLVGIKVENLEGFMYPDTYYFEKHESINKIIDVMYGRFKNILSGISGRDRITADDYKKIIIASIIEKETAKKDDMPLIASVIYNRLKRSMPLQMDSTVIYGIKNFDGNLTKKDLKDSDNYYNTYIYKGLPKTPVCNPSKDSLYAAYNPKESNYLYFVSQDGKNTIFSKTLREHNRWVRKYQKH